MSTTLWSSIFSSAASMMSSLGEFSAAITTWGTSDVHQFPAAVTALLTPLPRLSDWVPEVSTDGRPLVSTVTELFGHFPYDRLTPLPSTATGSESPQLIDRVVPTLVHYAMRPDVVALLLLYYVLVSEPVMAALRTLLVRLVGRESLRDWAPLRAAVAAHNLGLALFSGIVAFHTWRLVLRHYAQHGFLATYCDTQNRTTLWYGSEGSSGLGVWCIVFYLSKYYEFVDSWILVLKGKKVSFLQVYHHTGIAFLMWSAVASEAASWLQFVVVLNSTIHTIMYTYYFLKTVKPTLELPVAKYLTAAQIGQFLLGISSTLGVLVLGESCASASSRFGLVGLHLYGLGLIALFVSFAQQKYRPKHNE